MEVFYLGLIWPLKETLNKLKSYSRKTGVDQRKETAFFYRNTMNYMSQRKRETCLHRMWQQWLEVASKPFSPVFYFCSQAMPSLNPCDYVFRDWRKDARKSKNINLKLKLKSVHDVVEYSRILPSTTPKFYIMLHSCWRLIYFLHISFAKSGPSFCLGL